MRNERLYRMVMIAMMGSMAFLLMYFGEIHVPPFAEFLKYDPGDVPAVVATYTMGPAAGVGVQAIKAGIFFLSGKSTTGWVGVLANFLAGAGLVLGSGIAHRLLERSGMRHWGWGFLSAAIGTLVMAAV
ncbi:MAG: ECF transporter S component, partial [Bacillota bacterium]